MSNDNKTLADVQPGGRVRLGDLPVPHSRHEFNEWWSSQPCDISLLDTYEIALTAYRGGFTSGYMQSRAALAARQPMGKPVIDYADLVDQAKDLIQCGCSVNGAFDWLLEQLTDGEALAAPPAQAVDLRAVRDAEQGITLGFDGDLPYLKGIAEALALIDSQAVGNG